MEAVKLLDHEGVVGFCVAMALKHGYGVTNRCGAPMQLLPNGNLISHNQPAWHQRKQLANTEAAAAAAIALANKDAATTPPGVVVPLSETANDAPPN